MDDIAYHIETDEEFAQKTGNPELTLAILRLCNGGKGILVSIDNPPEPDIVFAHGYRIVGGGGDSR